MANKNIPYVKEYNENGEVTNPIKGGYINHFPARRKRRERETAFFGNGKNIPLSVTPNAKYKRVIQNEADKKGNNISIKHYILQ